MEALRVRLEVLEIRVDTLLAVLEVRTKGHEKILEEILETLNYLNKSIASQQVMLRVVDNRLDDMEDAKINNISDEPVKSKT